MNQMTANRLRIFLESKNKMEQKVSKNCAGFGFGLLISNEICYYLSNKVSNWGLEFETIENKGSFFRF